MSARHRRRRYLVDASGRPGVHGLQQKKKRERNKLVSFSIAQAKLRLRGAQEG
jgi:hypothetical protein